MKMKDAGKILHNRYVLYFILFLALSDLLYLAMGSEFISVAVFILSGFVTSFFSRNMMVIMCVAMVITNILKYGTSISVQEGLKEEDADEAKSEAKPADAKPNPADAKPEPADTKPKPAEDKIVLTEDEKRKFTENMEKLESYQPLFTSMDKMMEKINELISP